MPLEHRHLPRLDPGHYRGFAFVHWSMTACNRATGWLGDNTHARFREVLTHAAACYALACPVYCMMPDHVHLLLVGLSDESDQRLAIRFLRRHTSMLAQPHGWQREPYDHVLREAERQRGGLECVAHYILENPVRVELAARAQDYAFSGSVVLGFPGWTPFREDFWDRFWKIPRRKGRGLASRLRKLFGAAFGKRGYRTGTQLVAAFVKCGPRGLSSTPSPP